MNALSVFLSVRESFLCRWLGLLLTTTLAYILARALWSMVALGTLWFDWQWYLALLLFTLSLPLRILLRPPRKLTRWGLGLLGIWLIVGYGGFGQRLTFNVAAHPPPRISFWAFSDFTQIPDHVLADLHTAGGYIYLTHNPEALHGAQGQALAAGLRRLAAHNVNVILAPAMSDFLSTPTYAEWIDATWAAAAFVEREKLLNVIGLIGDAEHPLVHPFDPVGVERGRVGEMTRALQTLLHNLPERYPNVQVGVTAAWPLYLDGLDGDTDLAITLRSPVDPPGNWGFINQMTYSSYLPSAWRAYYVYGLETALAHRYPHAEVSHLIGLVGGGFPWEPLLGFDDLVRDARLSRALGVREMVVFQLNGALEVFGNDFVQRFTEAVNVSEGEVRVPFSRPASLILFGMALADAALDWRGWGGVGWLGWASLSAVLARRKS